MIRDWDIRLSEDPGLGHPVIRIPKSLIPESPDTLFLCYYKYICKGR
jgi:hypothetical protein